MIMQVPMTMLQQSSAWDIALGFPPSRFTESFSFSYLSLNQVMVSVISQLETIFRLYKNLQEKREEQLKAAHDEAMFGAPLGQTRISNTGDDVTETTNNLKDDEGESNSAATNLLSEKVKFVNSLFHFFCSSNQSIHKVE